MPRYVLLFPSQGFACGATARGPRDSILGQTVTYFFLPLQSENMNPIHGISKPGYEGKGFVQSPPLEKQ